MNFPPEVADQLGSYVYAYIDPRNDRIFYVGKGARNRAFQHLNDMSETRKTGRIKEIRDAGFTPRIDILAYGLTAKDAERIESVCIDLIGLDKLTNIVSGRKPDWGGRRPAEEIIDAFRAKPVEIKHPAITININQSYYYRMPEEELYEFTRGVWRIGERREGARFGLAVYHCIVKQVYEIESWHPAGSTKYRRRKLAPRREIAGRHEFVGKVAPEAIRKRYLGGRVTEATSRNPIRYFNC